MARKSRLTAYEQGIRTLEMIEKDEVKGSVRDRLERMKEKYAKANNKKEEGK